MTPAQADTFKKELFDQISSELELKANDFKTAVSNLRDGIANDSKSSMGDKYETSREMMQQEINHLEQQISINQQQLFYLKSFNLLAKNEQIVLGSLVQTNIGWFFIAVSFGEIKVLEQAIIVISPISPLGKILIGKKVNDEFEMNERILKILSVY
jgi:hypothetical protein